MSGLPLLLVSQLALPCAALLPSGLVLESSCWFAPPSPCSVASCFPLGIRMPWRLGARWKQGTKWRHRQGIS